MRWRFLVTKNIDFILPKAEWAQNIADTANPSSNIGMIIYVVLIIAFAYFMLLYKLIQKMADNLKSKVVMSQELDLVNKQKYITKVLYRLTFVGSIFLAAIAILPIIATNLWAYHNQFKLVVRVF